MSRHRVLEPLASQLSLALLKAESHYEWWLGPSEKKVQELWLIFLRPFSFLLLVQSVRGLVLALQCTSVLCFQGLQQTVYGKTNFSNFQTYPLNRALSSLSSWLCQGVDKLQTDFFSCPQKGKLIIIGTYLKVLFQYFFCWQRPKNKGLGFFFLRLIKIPFSLNYIFYAVLSEIYFFPRYFSYPFTCDVEFLVGKCSYLAKWTRRAPRL